mgnify:CR=1 FL=1
MRRQTVIIADDHPLILMGLRDLVDKDASFELLGTVSSSSALIALARENPPDILITDYSMPDDDVYGDGIRPVSYTHLTLPTSDLV